MSAISYKGAVDTLLNKNNRLKTKCDFQIMFMEWMMLTLVNFFILTLIMTVVFNTRLSTLIILPMSLWLAPYTYVFIIPEFVRGITRSIMNTLREYTDIVYYHTKKILNIPYDTTPADINGLAAIIDKRHKGEYIKGMIDTVLDINVTHDDKQYSIKEYPDLVEKIHAILDNPNGDTLTALYEDRIPPAIDQVLLEAYTAVSKVVHDHMLPEIKQSIGYIRLQNYIESERGY